MKRWNIKIESEPVAEGVSFTPVAYPCEEGQFVMQHDNVLLEQAARRVVNIFESDSPTDLKEAIGELKRTLCGS